MNVMFAGDVAPRSRIFSPSSREIPRMNSLKPVDLRLILCPDTGSSSTPCRPEPPNHLLKIRGATSLYCRVYEHKRQRWETWQSELEIQSAVGTKEGSPACQRWVSVQKQPESRRDDTFHDTTSVVPIIPYTFFESSSDPWLDIAGTGAAAADTCGLASAFAASGF